MAVKTRSAPTSAPAAAARGTAAPANVASLNPDNMVSAGLKDDFDGQIIKARFVPWDYNGTLDHHVLGVALTIKDDEEDEPFVQHYSAGDLEHFAPSMDGENPVDLESGEGEALEGVYAARVGKREGLANNTNIAQFLGALRDAGFDPSGFAADIRFLEGLYGHWNRIPQKKRSGIIVNAATDGAGNERKRGNDILVITELKDAPAPAKQTGKAAPAAKVVIGKPVHQSAAPAADDLDAKLVPIVVAALASAGDEGLAKQKLPSLALKNLAGADKAKGVKRIVDTEFLEAGGDGSWAYDADAGQLYPA